MHVPKAAGTSLMSALSTALRPQLEVRGFDRCLFGDFADIGSFSAALRGDVYVDTQALPAGATLVMGHFSRHTLQTRYKQACLVSFLREPFARLLSHFVFWRGLSDEELAPWGPAWSARVATARGPLSTFLSDPKLACQTDNVMLRMLLWPHGLVPPGGFIDPRHDATLVRAALGRLRRLDYADIVDTGEEVFARFAAWLGVSLALQRENETLTVPVAWRTCLADEMDVKTLALLQARSRLDLALWTALARTRMSEAAAVQLRATTIARATARCARLLRGP